MITEDQLVQLCRDWFKGIGFDAISGYEMALDKAKTSTEAASC